MSAQIYSQCKKARGKRECDHLKRKYKDDISYLEVDEENDDSKVDKSVGCGYQVRLLVHHKHQGRQQARLSRAEHLKI